METFGIRQSMINSVPNYDKQDHPLCWLSITKVLTFFEATNKIMKF